MRFISSLFCVALLSLMTAKPASAAHKSEGTVTIARNATASSATVYIGGQVSHVTFAPVVTGGITSASLILEDPATGTTFYTATYGTGAFTTGTATLSWPGVVAPGSVRARFVSTTASSTATLRLYFWCLD